MKNLRQPDWQVWAFISFFCFVGYFGLHLSWTRYYQVDEFSNAFNISLLGQESFLGYINYIHVFMIPMKWMSRFSDESVGQMRIYRTVFFVLFVLLVGLISWGQPFFRKRKTKLLCLWSIVLVVPLWEYALEIRHDVILTLLLSLFYFLVLRSTRPRAAKMFLLAGVLGAVMQFTASKSFVYWIPLSAFMLVYSCVRSGGWSEKTIFLISGFLAGSVVCSVVLFLYGHLGSYYSMIQMFLKFSPNAAERAVTSRLAFFGYLATATPHLLLLTAISLGICVPKIVRKSSNSDITVTTFFVIWVFVVSFVNPNPYKYNSLYLMPFMIFSSLALIKHASEAKSRGLPLFVGLIILLEAVLWLGHYARLRDETNFAQNSYIQAAELLTDRNTDPVIDGVGSVITRLPPGKDWGLHSLFMWDYWQGKLEHFSYYLENVSPPVAITNYRWRWLTPEDLDALKKRYLRYSQHLHVLGKHLGKHERDFTIHRSGYYKVMQVTAVPFPGLVDSRPVSPSGVVFLTNGKHTVELRQHPELLIYWVGPSLLDLPRIIEPQEGYMLFR